MKIQELRIDQKVLDTNNQEHIVEQISKDGTFQDSNGNILFAENVRPDPSAPYLLIGDDNQLKLAVETKNLLLTASAESSAFVGYDAIWTSAEDKNHQISIDISRHKLMENQNWIDNEIYENGLLTGCEDPECALSVDAIQALKDKAELEHISLQI